MKILLVNPDISGVSVGFSSLARVAPLGLLMVAGSVPEHECRILDMRLEENSAFDEALQRFRPDVIGLTAYSAEAEAAKALAQRAKQALPGVPMIGRQLVRLFGQLSKPSAYLKAHRLLGEPV